MVSINFIRTTQSANPLLDYVWDVDGEAFRCFPVVHEPGTEEHLNKSCRDMVALRRAPMCHGVAFDPPETCQNLIRALARIQEDTIHCRTLLESIDPAVWLPAMREAWRQPGAGESHAFFSSEIWIRQYV